MALQAVPAKVRAGRRGGGVAVGAHRIAQRLLGGTMGLGSSPSHRTPAPAPVQLVSEFQAFKHMECLAPGTIARASSPLEVTLSIQPTLVLQNALPYEMRVLLWQHLPTTAAADSGVPLPTTSGVVEPPAPRASPWPQHGASRARVPATPTARGGDSSGPLPALLDLISPRGGGPPAANRRGAMGRYFSHTIPPGGAEVGRLACGACMDVAAGLEPSGTSALCPLPACLHTHAPRPTRPAEPVRGHAAGSADACKRGGDWHAQHAVDHGQPGRAPRHAGRRLHGAGQCAQVSQGRGTDAPAAAGLWCARAGLATLPPPLISTPPAPSSPPQAAPRAADAHGRAGHGPAHLPGPRVHRPVRPMPPATWAGGLRGAPRRPLHCVTLSRLPLPRPLPAPTGTCTSSRTRRCTPACCTPSSTTTQRQRCPGQTSRPPWAGATQRDAPLRRHAAGACAGSLHAHVRLEEGG